MKTLSLQFFRAAGATSAEASDFESRFGQSVEISESFCRTHVRQFDWLWMAHCLLPLSSRAEFDELRSKSLSANYALPVRDRDWLAHDLLCAGAFAHAFNS